MKTVCEWSEIPERKWDTLILGNGASIALHDSFNYKSLYEVAKDKNWLSTTLPVFESLQTTNFEHILEVLRNALIVNVVLTTPSEEVVRAYHEVRDALRKSIVQVHPQHATIYHELLSVAGYAKQFDTVINLNYDVLFYWAMLLYNANERAAFKDAFVSGSFKPRWRTELQNVGKSNSATFVFYPHGSVLFVRDEYGGERKIRAGDSDLINTIVNSWKEKEIPLLVSGGLSSQKKNAIYGSSYLSHVYEEVLPRLGSSIVIYGWSIADNDQHILEALASGSEKPSIIAVSVLRDKSDVIAIELIESKIRKVLADTEVVFYFADSCGCWKY